MSTANQLPLVHKSQSLSGTIFRGKSAEERFSRTAPWTIEHYGKEQFVYADEGSIIIAQLETDMRTDDEIEANGKLICAAPKLLDACVEALHALRMCCGNTKVEKQLMDAINAAI